MRRATFWTGFACGVTAAIGGSLIAGSFRRGGASRILRLEKSIQIACPVDRVFANWSDFDTLAGLSDSIRQVRVFGDHSRLRVKVKGMPIQWEAEITQIIPDQEIAWKSVSGPKHSGRVTFSPIGNDTLVHVHMNYAPPLRILRRALAPFSGDLEGYIEQVLREFKAGLEHQGARTKSGEVEAARATGTQGAGPELLREKQQFGAPSTPMESTRPPEAKS
jgi:uncharacterized membrane protein